MKCLVVVLAAVALVSAADDKKPEEPKQEEKPEPRGGLQWPLPDPSSEGDLMLHGALSYDRVEALHKVKAEDEVDRTILDHGRQFLRRVAKWFDENADLRILPALCRDTRDLNGTVNRWRIEVAKEQASRILRDEPLPNNPEEDKPKNKPVIEAPRANITHDNETVSNTSSPVSNTSESVSNTTEYQSNSSAPIVSNSSEPVIRTQRDAPIAEDKQAITNSTERPNATEPPRPREITFEDLQTEFYRSVGSNFARLLVKQYRKDALNADESAYLARWLAEEAVHYGAVAIYCREGENVKEIRKQLAIFLEEKA